MDRYSEKRYYWQDDLVYNYSIAEVYGNITRIVPTKFTNEILMLAHNFTGHLSTANVRKILAPYFTWPGTLTYSV